MNTQTQDIQKTLKSLIDQTYKIQKEYKILNESYINLKNFTADIVECLGGAIWVVNEKMQVILKNAASHNLDGILSLIKFDKSNQEVEFKSKFYAVKITQKGENKVILATDIDDEKRSARLASMGAVAAHLSHEIRNPIGSISILTSALQKRAKLENLPLIDEIQKAVFRVERIIKATLLFTKGVHLKKGLIDLQKLKFGFENSIKYYSYSKEIEFKFDGFNGVLNGDIDLLDMVFSNFIFNAIDAIEESAGETGEVEITHKLDGGEHVFYIKDTGVEIDPSAVFEPFKTTKLKGNGLGIALSIEIISAHNGSITLQKDPKLFTITLPA